MSDDKQNGTVKWFDEKKGYGFICPESGDKDIFVHITAVHSSGLDGLKDGQQLSFGLSTERGHTSATNLEIRG